MKNRRIHQILIYFLILISTIISSTSLILCFGEDGSVLLEVKISSLNSCTEKIITQSNNSNLAQSTNHCRNCFDINLFFEISGIQSKINIDYLIDNIFMETYSYNQTYLPQKQVKSKPLLIPESVPNYIISNIIQETVLLI